MNYLEAPTEMPDPITPEPCVFLAGGIGGCPNWQKTIRDSLEDLDDGTLINPRRDNLPIRDKEAGFLQIKWEFEMLWNWTDIFSMWFCKETIGPICLFELGAHLARVAVAMRCRTTLPFQQVVIGFDPDYERAFDVVAQTGLILGDNFPFGMSLDQHAANIRKAVIDCQR